MHSPLAASEGSAPPARSWSHCSSASAADEQVASPGVAKSSLALRRSAEPGLQVGSGASFARAAIVVALAEQALLERRSQAEGFNMLAHELLAQQREIEDNTNSRLQRSLKRV